jgi:hypothetical protein
MNQLHKLGAAANKLNFFVIINTIFAKTFAAE